jgi:hypothetical protein
MAARRAGNVPLPVSNAADDLIQSTDPVSAFGCRPKRMPASSARVVDGLELSVAVVACVVRR